MSSLFRHLAKHSLFYGIGDMLRRLISFLLIPVYTHALTPSEYGQLELLELTSFIVAALLGLGVSSSIVRFYYLSEDWRHRSQVFSNAFLCAIVAGLITLLVFIPGASTMSQLVFGNSENTLYFQLVFCAMIFDFFNEIGVTFLRINDRSLFFSGVSFLRLLIQVALNILFLVYLEMGVKGVVISTVVASFISSAIVVIFTLRKIVWGLNLPLLKQMALFGLPILVSSLSMFVAHYGDRFFLQRLATPSELGVYALAYKFGMLPYMLVYSTFIQTWSVKRFDIANDGATDGANDGGAKGDRADNDSVGQHSGPSQKISQIFSSVFTHYCFFIFYLGLGVSCMIRDTMPLVAQSEYHSAALYVPIVVLAYIFNGCAGFVQFGLLYHKKTRTIGWASFVASVVNIVANVALIPYYGALGAAFATLACFGTLFVFTLVASQKVYYVAYDYRRVMVLFSSAVLYYILVSSLSFSNSVLGIAVAFMISATYPLALWAGGFFNSQEQAMLRSTVSELFTRLRRA